MNNIYVATSNAKKHPCHFIYQTPIKIASYKWPTNHGSWSKNWEGARITAFSFYHVKCLYSACPLNMKWTQFKNHHAGSLTLLHIELLKFQPHFFADVLWDWNPAAQFLLLINNNEQDDILLLWTLLSGRCPISKIYKQQTNSPPPPTFYILSYTETLPCLLGKKKKKSRSSCLDFMQKL